MFTNKIRHLTVAVGLAVVAVVGITGASAAGFVHHANTPAAQRKASPVASGDLGEVVVHAPHDLGEIIVHAPHDLGEVLVLVHRVPVEGEYLAHVVVTVPRETDASYRLASEPASRLAALQ